jgi:hypothetical protein
LRGNLQYFWGKSDFGIFPKATIYAEKPKKEDSPLKSYPPSREFRGMDLDVFL